MECDRVITKLDIKELKKVKSGKVREIFKIDENLLMVATDRLSAFDVVFNEGIPCKGFFLNQISAMWFSMLDFVENHIVATNWEDFPDKIKKFDEIKDRSMIVKNIKPILYECVVRGYITGSGWKDYQKTGKICGIELPKGLNQGDKLDEPIFTPATKADTGHDENIDFEKMKKDLGEEVAQKLKNISIKIYKYAYKKLIEKDIILVDTKFEFGLVGNNIVLIDEVLTPDSSRFWRKGKEGISIDKQYIRDYLETLNWNKKPPAPELPEDIIKETSKRYEEMYNIVKSIQEEQNV